MIHLDTMQFVRFPDRRFSSGKMCATYRCVFVPPETNDDSAAIIITCEGIVVQGTIPALSVGMCVILEETLMRARLHLQHLQTNDTPLSAAEIDRLLTATIPKY